MNIYELENHEMNLALAYALGLMYPLYKEKKLNEKEYILGCVNHNSGMITQNEINAHYIAIRELFNKYIGANVIELKTNKCTDYRISSKEGFSVLIEKTGVSKEKCIEIMTKRVEEIKESSDDIKKEFVKGCFDGRASWDKTAHLLSIDVDRDYNRQDLIRDIVVSLGIDLNINRRVKNHPKHDQLRIKRNSLRYFMDNINFYSICRANIVNNAINSI